MVTVKHEATHRVPHPDDWWGESDAPHHNKVVPHGGKREHYHTHQTPKDKKARALGTLGHSRED